MNNTEQVEACARKLLSQMYNCRESSLTDGTVIESEFGMDSLSFLELLVQMEDCLDIEIDENRLPSDFISKTFREQINGIASSIRV